MPSGNPPTSRLSVYLINSSTIGSFGPSLREITRIGLSKLRYVKGANRGQRNQATGIHFTATEAEAKEKIAQMEGLQGKEVEVLSTSTEKNWTLFFISVSAFYRPCDGTNAARNYIIRFSIDCQRTL